MKIENKIKQFLKVNILKEKSPKGLKENKCYIMMAADYGNMGDIAITYAQRKFLEDNIRDDYDIIEVPMKKVYPWARDIRNNLGKKDIITIIGGGNTGDYYLDFEEKRRFIINFFKNTKIISFPQTIDFSNTNKGKKELKNSVKIYSKNNLLRIFARESKSFEIYKNRFQNNKIYLVPDIVLSLNEERIQERNGILICLRNDKEQALNEESKNRFIEKLNSKYKDIIYQDTHIGNITIDMDERKNALDTIWDKFRGAKIIITDRLHGMIFAAITGTPCIAFKNTNYKVEQTYIDWLKDYEYIKLFKSMEDENEILKIIEYFYNLEKTEYTHKGLKNQYSTLIDQIKE